MFRPAFENLEKREVFSVAQPVDPVAGTNNVYVEEVSSGFVSQTRPASDGILAASGDGAYSFAVGPDFRGIAGDFNDDAPLDFAIKSPRDSASGQATAVGLRATPVMNPTSMGVRPVTGGSVDYTNPNHSARFIDNIVFDRMILPYIEQDNVYNLTGARETTFAQLGPRGILLDLEARGNIVDGTSNTILFAHTRAASGHACVTDLVIDPFDSNR